jgi:hypothetical protein
MLAARRAAVSQASAPGSSERSSHRAQGPQRAARAEESRRETFRDIPALESCACRTSVSVESPRHSAALICPVFLGCRISLAAGSFEEEVGILPSEAGYGFVSFICFASSASSILAGRSLGRVQFLKRCGMTA